MRGAGVLVLFLLVAVALAGCVGGPGGGSGFDFTGGDAAAIVCADTTGVDNEMGTFSYGGTATCKTESESYDWANPTPRASVAWGGAVASGSLSVAILDSLGQEVYAFTVDGTGAEGASGATEVGMPGPMIETWSVELEFKNFAGTMGLDLTSTT